MVLLMIAGITAIAGVGFVLGKTWDFGDVLWGEKGENEGVNWTSIIGVVLLFIVVFWFLVIR